MKAPTRSPMRFQRAQAIVEMALVIPILFYITFAFIGCMIIVQTQQELQTALQLAAQSSFQADQGTYSGGVLTDCLYAEESFNGTMSYYGKYLVWQKHPLCTICKARGASGLNAVSCGSSVPMADVTCDIEATPPGGAYPNEWSTTCRATATIDFAATPIGFAIFWNPTLTARSSAVPPPFRQ